MLSAGCWPEQAGCACVLVRCMAEANLPLTGALAGLGLGTGAGLGLTPSSCKSAVGIATSFLLSVRIGLLGPGLAAGSWNVNVFEGGTGTRSALWLVATDTLGLGRRGRLLVLVASASGAVAIVLLVGNCAVVGGGTTTASESRVLLVPLAGRGAGSLPWSIEGDVVRLLLLLDVAGSGPGDSTGKSADEGLSMV